MASSGEARCGLAAGDVGHSLPPKRDQSLGRAPSSEVQAEDEPGAAAVGGLRRRQPAAAGTTSVPEMVRCECCGMSEECTPTYIARVKEFHCGKWVCGLCSEAMKELVKKNAAASMQEALESHMALCMKFNRTVRLNPKLSFARSMRDIARKSSQRRSSADFIVASGIARTSSCSARIISHEVDESPDL